MAVVEVVTIIAMGLGAVAGITGAIEKEKKEKLKNDPAPRKPPEPVNQLTAAELRAIDRWFKNRD